MKTAKDFLKTGLGAKSYTTIEKIMKDFARYKAKDLLEACQEFVRKVECGEARSKKSYKQMKEAIKNFDIQ